MKRFRQLTTICIALTLLTGLFYTFSLLSSSFNHTINDEVYSIPESATRVSKSQNLSNPTFKVIDRNEQGTFQEREIFLVEIKNPKNLKALNFPKALLISQLDFHEVEISLNGIFIGNFSGGQTALDYIKIPISNEILKNDILTLTLKTHRTKYNTGLRDTLFFLGRTNQLTNIYFHAERVKLTKPLLLTMVFVSFIFVFLLFQFLVRKETLYWYALLLSCCSLISVIYAGNLSLLFSSDKTRVLLLFLSRSLWSYFLILLFSRISKLQLSKTVQFIGLFVVVVSSLLTSILTSLGLISSNLGIALISVVMCLGPIISLFICLKQMAMFKQSNKKGTYLRIVCIFLGFITSLCLYIAITKNLNLLPYFDITILIILTINSALEFRFNEQTIEKQNSLIVAQAQDAAIGDTAKMMAHDLRKPLEQLSSILENFEEHKMTPGKMARITDELNYSIDHSENLLATLLDFSRESSLELKEHSLKSIIKEALKFNKKEILRHNVQIHFELGHHMMVLANKERIVRVISNLISNAIEAQTLMSNTPNKHIRFVTSQENKVTTLSIINNGPLIPSKDVSQLFEAFYSKGKPSGTGLGLASCRKIINLHGQKIWANNLKKTNEVQISFTLEAGSTSDHGALIWKEASEEIESNLSNTCHYGVGATKITVYSCNDDLLSNMNLETTFKKCIEKFFPEISLELHLFDKGEDLLEAYKANHPILVICDYMMDKSGGKLNGAQVIDRIKSVSNQGQCYLLTNWEFNESVDSPVLHPPFKVLNCKKLIEEHLFFLEKRIHS